MALIHRSNVEQNKLTPLPAEDHILTKYYGKSKKFSNAVDEMKTVLSNIKEEAEKVERSKTMEKIKQKTVRIQLKKIETKQMQSTMTLRSCKINTINQKKGDKSDPTRSTMTLRKRK